MKVNGFKINVRASLNARETMLMHGISSIKWNMPTDPHMRSVLNWARTTHPHLYHEYVRLDSAMWHDLSGKRKQQRVNDAAAELSQVWNKLESKYQAEAVLC